MPWRTEDIWDLTNASRHSTLRSPTDQLHQLTESIVLIKNLFHKGFHAGDQFLKDGKKKIKRKVEDTEREEGGERCFHLFRLQTLKDPVNEVHMGADTGALEHQEQDGTRQGSKHWLSKSSTVTITKYPKLRLTNIQKQNRGIYHG